MIGVYYFFWPYKVLSLGYYEKKNTNVIVLKHHVVSNSGANLSIDIILSLFVWEVWGWISSPVTMAFNK